MRARELRNLLNEVAQLAAHLGRELDVAPHEVAIVTLFDRGRSTFGAVRVLLDAGFGHEAVTLGRSLFTESLMLAELGAVDEPRRTELVVGWWLAGLADFEGIIRDGIALGDGGEDDLAAIAMRRAQLERYAADRGARARYWKPAEKALANTHGRAREYLDFRLAHHFVHGSALAAEQRSSKRADDTLVVGGPGADSDTWGPPAGLFAATSLLHACQAVCRIFGWQEPPALADLLRRCDEAIAAFNLPAPTTESAHD